MSKKIISKPLAIAMGTALVGGFTAAAAVNAADVDPFEMEDLTSGQLIAGDGEGSCGEDKGEGSCGEDKGEGSCGEDKGEGSCGEDKKGEGSCGEGKCGGAA